MSGWEEREEVVVVDEGRDTMRRPLAAGKKIEKIV